MNILLAAPLRRSITPTTSASRSRLVYLLAEELLKRGHRVSILASEDSIVAGAYIIPVIPSGFVHLTGFENPFYAETSYLVAAAKKIQDIGNDFDVIHNHTYPEFINLLVADTLKTPILSTIHLQATKELDHVLSLFPNTHIAAISNEQKNLFTKAKIDFVVHNGVQEDFFTPIDNPHRSYMLFVGRMGKARNQDGTFIDQKGVQNAIATAKKANMPLKIVGNIEDPEFYTTLIEPHLGDAIELVGGVHAEQTVLQEALRDLYRNAKVLIFPINQGEPFGLVLAEAMSCGTPAVAYDRGAAREIVEDGLTGYIVNPHEKVDGLVAAVNKINALSKEKYDAMGTAGRKRVVDKFALGKMVDGYEEVYQKIRSLS